MRKIGIGKKLMVGGFIVISIPMLAVSSYLIARSGAILTEFSQNMATQTVDKLTSMVRTVTDKEVAQVKGLSVLSQVVEVCGKAKKDGPGSVKEEAKRLDAQFHIILQQLGDQYSGMFVTDTKGLALAGVLGNGDTKPYETMDVSDRDYFKEAKNNGKADVASIVKSKATNQPVMVVYSPIRSEKGEFLGILALSAKVDLLINLVAATKVGQTGYAFMLDEKGMVIAHPRRELILELNAASQKGAEELTRKMTSQAKGLISYTFEGKEKVSAFAPVGVRSWSIAVVEPREELLARVKDFRDKGILIGAALLGAALMLILFFVRSLTRPISRVIEGLSGSAHQVTLASGQVSDTGRQLAEGTSEQAASIEETSSSLEQMSSMAQQNAENANQAEQLMKGTRETVSRANQTMEKLTASMGEISRASEQTSKIIKTIDEIAFQTNLLALNAAVEAARAGEAGAGFAVVADEVRNLATRAAEAAQNTAGLIEATVRQVKEGSELVEQTGKEFQNVAVSVDKSGQLVAEISAGSQEQAQGIGQMNKAISEMDKVVQQNAANAEETASTSEEMSAQAARMKKFVAELAAVVGGANRNGTGGNAEQAGVKTLVQSVVVSAATRFQKKTENVPVNRSHHADRPAISAGVRKNRDDREKKGGQFAGNKAGQKKLIPFSDDEDTF